jgi:hypothetical protein
MPSIKFFSTYFHKLFKTAYRNDLSRTCAAFKPISSLTIKTVYTLALV